jgi:hypothetical protein
MKNNFVKSREKLKVEIHMITEPDFGLDSIEKIENKFS